MPKSFYKTLVLEIPKGVYEPREDSFLLAQVLEKENLVGKKVLDLGTGSGLLAIIAAKSGCEVFAADIVPETLECARKNAISNNAKINFILSDLFENIPEKFDLIVFNPPYLPEQISADSRVWAAGKNLELIMRAVGEAKSHLKDGGKLFMVLSSLSNENKIMKKLAEVGLKAKISAEQKIPWEKLFVIQAQKPNL